MSSYSQGQNNFWCFGDSAGIDFSNVSNPIPFACVGDSRGTCISISDASGHLLFNGTTVAGSGMYTGHIWNKIGSLMENGDSIVGEAWYNELIILPMPGDSMKYYIFSLFALSPYGLYYSVVDMSENGGLGKVVQKNIQIQSYQAWDAMAAVRHANGRDWWLVTKDWDNSSGSNNFHINLITPQTISESIQYIGGNEYGNSGNMSFSRDGSKFVFTSYNGLIEVMDFDRCTGLLTNPKVIINATNPPRYWGSAFSPSGQVLYVSTSDTTSYLYQFDLTAPNILASRATICTISRPWIAGGALRLAPDDKIYWTCAWTNQIVFIYPYQDTMYHQENMNLSVINDPDVLGAGCNFSLYSFYLGGKRTYWGLPNNPDYTMGPLSGSVCDSLTTIPELAGEEFTIYPNPANEELLVEEKSEWQGKKIIRIFNSVGSLVKIIFIDGASDKFLINVKELPAGVYFVSLNLNNKCTPVKKLIVLH